MRWLKELAGVGEIRRIRSMRSHKHQEEETMNAPRFARSLRGPLTIVALFLFSAGSAWAQPGPTPEHKILQKDVGTWDAIVKVWPQPGAEPMESRGTETNELLGGMWIVSKFEGKMDDMPFSGTGVFGYDPAEKKYVGTWVDSMSPSLSIVKGDYDSATKTMTTTGDMRDPASGAVTTTKQISRYLDDDTRVFEMQVPGEGGTYWKMMEIQYKRRAE